MIHRLKKGKFSRGRKKQNDNFTTRQMVQAWNGACRGADNAAKQKAIVATSMVYYVILVLCFFSPIINVLLLW